MTKQEATIIKNWRQIGDYTWRRIAVLAAITWPDEKYCSENQEEGVGLCEEAARVLGEDPWN